MKRMIKLFTAILFLAAIAFPAAAQENAVSGTYVLEFQGVELSITYDGNAFSVAQNGNVFSKGTFRVAGDSIFHGNSTSVTYTIIDENTIRDASGDDWKKLKVS